ncbi:MAG: diadenylate cyclase [Syntrophobacterales bacterium]|nr:MAG: diadenylate cyclase [Syntrophobacterales bacterium]
MRKENKLMLEIACTIAERTKAKAILVYADVCEDYEALIEMIQSAKTDIIAAAKDESIYQEALPIIKNLLKVPQIELSRTSQIKVALIEGLSSGIIQSGDKLVCLSGISRFGILDTLIILEIGKELEILSTTDLPVVSEVVKPEVFDRTLGIALELSTEGREGRPVGSIFVLGDHEEVFKFSHQMVINPFKGYPEEERNILDPKLKDTLKEFSTIDGAFIIREDGVILAAGRHLDASGKKIEMPMGLGSRHLAAAGITNVAQAIALVISESTGSVRIFSKGKLFMEIERGE